MKNKQLYRFFLCLLVICGFKNTVATAQPDFSTKQVIEGTIIYRDFQNKDLFYYAPGKLRLVEDAGQKPAFKFLQMRYTGTKATADQGARRFNSLLKFKVSFENATPEMLKSFMKYLPVRNEDIEFRMLPLHKIEAILVYASIDHKESRNHVLTGGFFGESAEASGDLWQERIYTLRLDPHSAQAFEQAFESGRSLLSVGYAYYAYGVNNNPAELDLQGDEGLVSEMKQRFSQMADTIAGDSEVSARLVLADAFQIIIDTQKYPDLIEKVDINENIPPDYAAVDVYCYDFNNQLRPDLHAKKIEIKAEGVGNQQVVTKVIFRERDADIYAHNIRFKHSVRMDFPLQYRIIEITKEGNINVFPWKKQKSWSEVLDVTSLNK